jgi:hypothetical protein
MPVSFEDRCGGVQAFPLEPIWAVRKHDLVYINNKEYTVIEVSFGGNSGKRLIVAQHCNGEKIEMLLNRTDMIHACTQNGPKNKQPYASF